jgi:hypothetical protein
MRPPPTLCTRPPLLSHQRPTFELLTVEHPLSPGLLAIEFDASARALLLYPVQPHRQRRHLVPTYFIYFDNRMLCRHLLPRHFVHHNCR